MLPVSQPDMTLSDQELFGDDRPRDHCGVFGVWAPGEDVSRLTYFSLYALQHRGQQSAGIATSNGKQILVYKDQGLVSHVFSEQSLQGLLGKNVRDQALILVHEDLLAVGGRDAGALLAAMLEGVEGEVGETRNVLARGPHSEDAAVIAGTIVSEELLIGQCHVWLRDGKHDSTLSHFSSLSGTCPRCATHTRSLRGDPSVNCACFPPGHPVTRWPRCHNGVQQP